MTDQSASDPISESIARHARRSGPNVVGMLQWPDPNKQWWIAPLGSAEPTTGRPPPPEWAPVAILRRTDMV
jgi:hypothetical protein